MEEIEGEFWRVIEAPDDVGIFAVTAVTVTMFWTCCWVQKLKLSVVNRINQQMSFKGQRWVSVFCFFLTETLYVSHHSNVDIGPVHIHSINKSPVDCGAEWLNICIT